VAEGLPSVVRCSLDGVEHLLVLLPDGTERALEAELSSAERETLALVLEGRSNAQVATERGVSQGTVAKQIASLFGKLGVHSRTELMARLCGGTTPALEACTPSRTRAR
jgi:DNA-binding NarL/FixJ family response regulator